MDIFEFITQQEISELPENSEAAFSQFVRHVSQGLSRTYNNAAGNDDEGAWRIYREAQFSYQNIIIAAARSYGIEPFASMDVPSLQDFSDRDYRQFKSDLDHYVTQILLGSATKDSVALSDKSKDKIRQYTYNLREAVEQSQMPDDKRAGLLSKLEAFEVELNKRRTNLMEVAKVAFAIFAAPGALWSSVEIAQKLTTNIIQIVAEEKSQEEETKQITANSIGILGSPRKAAPEKEANSDEIPF